MKQTNGDLVEETLSEFTRDYGVPSHITFDGAAVKTGSNNTQLQKLTTLFITYVTNNNTPYPMRGCTSKPKGRYGVDHCPHQVQYGTPL